MVALSCDPPAQFKKQKVQISMLLRSRFAPVRGACSHVVYELMMLVGKTVLLPLTVKRNLGPLERAVGVTECAGAVLLAFRCPHALGVAFDAGAFDRSADFLLIGVAQAATAVLNMIGEIEKAAAILFQFPRHRTHGGKGYALIV